jgi:caa(3)-type oxidase subunit IV
MTRYVLTWIALVALATLSLFVSGSSIALSLAIAALKAALVGAFFMHLWGTPPVHRIVFVTAVAFLVLLVLGVVADVGARDLAGPYVP